MIAGGQAKARNVHVLYFGRRGAQGLGQIASSPQLHSLISTGGVSGASLGGRALLQGARGFPLPSASVPTERFPHHSPEFQARTLASIWI